MRNDLLWGGLWVSTKKQKGEVGGGINDLSIRTKARAHPQRQVIFPSFPSDKDRNEGDI
jgi:hypothetical protein